MIKHNASFIQVSSLWLGVAFFLGAFVGRYFDELLDLLTTIQNKETMRYRKYSSKKNV